jgi:hypothetical protein
LKEGTKILTGTSVPLDLPANGRPEASNLLSNQNRAFTHFAT